MDKIPHIDDLIVKYLSGELSVAERDKLQAWIKMSPENNKYFLDKQEIWFSSIVGMDDDKFDAKAAYNVFLSRIEPKNKNVVRHRLYWQRALAVAAVVAIVFVASLFSYKHGGNEVKDQFADIVIEAPLGSRTKLYLPDSTLVWLNAGSSLTYSQGFGVSERKVHISGEGYFEVRRNEKLPMQVISDELLVEVLGTTFNVRNYSDEEEIVVSLEKGKIVATNMFNDDEHFTLKPDQKVTLNRRSRKMFLSGAEAHNLAGWTDGNLFFDEKLLPDIVQTLERSYNVRIHLADESLNSFRFYCQFSRTDHSINEVLDRLAATNRIDYRIDGKDIIILPRN